MLAGTPTESAARSSAWVRQSTEHSLSRLSVSVLAVQCILKALAPLLTPHDSKVAPADTCHPRHLMTALARSGMHMQGGKQACVQTRLQRLRVHSAPRRIVHARIAAPEAPPSAQAPAVGEPEPSAPPSIEDPWEDPKWLQYKWTVYRGVAYDLTSFMDRHPGGNWLLNLSLGRDCTALFESYHLRPQVAVARLNQLPKLSDFPIDAVPVAPRPNDSELYNAIRERVRQQVFQGQVRHSHQLH